MGSEDLHWKRKAKSRDRLKRHAAKRAPYDYVLIVCEGKKTEPYYFRELCDHLELNSANIEVVSSDASDPLNVVRTAKKRYREDKSIDRVYCVFDGDCHGYSQAVEMVRNLRPAKVFFSATSVPCFEFWLLLHFENTTRPFAPSRGQSACGVVLGDLRGHLTDYEKGSRHTFAATNGYLATAKERAIQVRRAALGTGSTGPFTDVDELVGYLEHLKRA